MWTDNRLKAGVIIVVLLGVTSVTAHADFLPVVNGSFELPETVFATPSVQGWVTDGPIIDPDFHVNLYTGVFLNTAMGAPDHIDNAVGDQLAFIGTQTGNEIVQLIPDSAFEAGRYVLRAGIARSYGSPPSQTDLLRIALFYQEDPNQRVIVASMDIVNDPNTGLSPNSVTYFSAQTEVLGPEHPAIGKAVGVLLTTVGQLGGFFDAEDVAVEHEPCPYQLAGDVNGDCVHDLLDFAIYSQTWLIDCWVTPGDPACGLP